MMEEHAYSVLLVSASESFNESLLALLRAFGCAVVKTVDNISAAKRASAERVYDFVIVNTPLPDDMGVRFAVDVCTAGDSVVLLLVRNELHDEIRGKVTAHGVFTLAKPVSKPMMRISLGWMASVPPHVLRNDVAGSRIFAPTLIASVSVSPVGMSNVTSPGDTLAVSVRLPPFANVTLSPDANVAALPPASRQLASAMFQFPPDHVKSLAHSPAQSITNANTIFGFILILLSLERSGGRERHVRLAWRRQHPHFTSDIIPYPARPGCPIK